jgi:hypothetical protein
LGLIGPFFLFGFSFQGPSPPSPFFSFGHYILFAIFLVTATISRLNVRAAARASFLFFIAVASFFLYQSPHLHSHREAFSGHVSRPPVFSRAPHPCLHALGNEHAHRGAMLSISRPALTHRAPTTTTSLAPSTLDGGISDTRFFVAFFLFLTNAHCHTMDGESSSANHADFAAVFRFTSHMHNTKKKQHPLYM